jgi:hypothetical protein
MQEVRSSNLLSSTGQKRNSNGSNSEYISKVPQRDQLRCRTCVRTGVLNVARAAGRTADTRRRSGVTRPVSWANSHSLGAVTLAVCSRPGSCERPCLTVTVAVFADGRRAEVRAPALLRAAAAAATAACSLVRRGTGCAGSARCASQARLRRGAIRRVGCSAAAPRQGPRGAAHEVRWAPPPRTRVHRAVGAPDRVSPALKLRHRALGAVRTVPSRPPASARSPAPAASWPRWT